MNCHQSYWKEISQNELWTKSSDMLTAAKVKEDSTNTHLTFSTLLISFKNIYGVAVTVNLMYTELEP